MNVLLIGSGGREHAIAWKLSQSPRLGKLFIVPGNPGTALLGVNVPIGVTEFKKIGSFALSEKIDLVVVGPEVPLVKGIHDFFLADQKLKNIPVIGPQKAGAQLEGSKDFAKQFMTRHGIPTAAYQTFTSDSLSSGIKFLHSLNPPYVLKADGLAAGKGVVICNSLQEAENELTAMLVAQKFGDASAKVVIEEFLTGIELSAFAITDGKQYLILPEAKDYKRIGEGDTGPNTGGMGSVSPVPFVDEIFLQKIEQWIIKPTIVGLIAEKIPFCGFLFFGLINVNGDPFMIEYNVRLGDPETESILPRIKNDLLEIFIATVEGRLSEVVLETDERTAACVMLVSGGYPGDYQNGKSITGIEKVKESIIFHAGTAKNDDKLVTHGGRVIAVTSLAENIPAAVKKSIQSASCIQFDGVYFRQDIGKDLIVN